MGSHYFKFCAYSETRSYFYTVLFHTRIFKTLPLRNFINILYRIISNLRISNPAHKVKLHYYFKIATFQSGTLQTLIKRDRTVYLATMPRFRYSSAPVSTGNTFQDLPRLREIADNTERYI
jgi:hypothetical protein